MSRNAVRRHARFARRATDVFMRSVLPIVLLVALLATVAAKAQVTQLRHTPDEYADALARLDADLARLDPARPAEADNVLARVPALWRIERDGRSVTESSAAVRQALQAWRSRPDAAALTRLRARVQQQRADAEGYRQGVPDTAASRATLARILSAREFAGNRGPSWFDRLLQRALQLLERLVSGLFGSSAFPTISIVVVYVLIGLAVVVAALWAAQALTRNTRLDLSRSMESTAIADSWRDWLDRAREAASIGDWRDAVRFAYWSGITHLESKDVWRVDLARTPREYLGLLPAGSPHRDPLRGLTDLLERVWYADEAATPARFDEALTRLKDLGCPSV